MIKKKPTKPPFAKVPEGKKEEIKKLKELQIEELGDLPLVGGLFKGLGKLIDLAERVEEAGGEIKKMGEIKGLGEKTKGIYGFSIRTGIGGKPKIQTFGNIRPTGVKEVKPSHQKFGSGGKPKIKITEEREPIVDVFDEKDYILVVAELPGVSEESIKLELKGDILILEAGDEKRKYSKEILLPAKVDFESKEEIFKNGILEIKLKKK